MGYPFTHGFTFRNELDGISYPFCFYFYPSEFKLKSSTKIAAAIRYVLNFI